MFDWWRSQCVQLEPAQPVCEGVHDPHGVPSVPFCGPGVDFSRDFEEHSAEEVSLG